jgi:uridine kinase
VYERLPSDIASRQVLLMDPLVGTGRTACRAVEVRWDSDALQPACNIACSCILLPPQPDVCTLSVLRDA